MPSICSRIATILSSRSAVEGSAAASEAAAAGAPQAASSVGDPGVVESLPAASEALGTTPAAAATGFASPKAAGGSMAAAEAFAGTVEDAEGLAVRAASEAPAGAPSAAPTGNPEADRRLPPASEAPVAVPQTGARDPDPPATPPRPSTVDPFEAVSPCSNPHAFRFVLERDGVQTPNSLI